MNDKVTYFEPPQRSSENELVIDREIFLKERVSKELLEGFPDLVVVLNQNRQIVASNSAALNLFNKSELDIFGKRLGEAINCIYANQNKEGCGTSEFCVECGAAKAIRSTRLTSKSTVMECRLIASENESEKNFDLEVSTRQFEIENRKFIIAAIKDISNLKRKEYLERVFFHDILNTANAINSIINILPEADNLEETNELIEALQCSSNQLLREIISQRELKEAEAGNLILNIENFPAVEPLLYIADIYEHHEIRDGVRITTDIKNNLVNIESDKIQIGRCLGNLIKNALEESNKDDIVNLSLIEENDHVIYSIHNQKYIPDNIQKQIFQRSFSTKKEIGRGLGTYSVKLITEKYLNGSVYFKSTPNEGTTFYLKINKSFN